MANEELKVRLSADDQLTSKVKAASTAVKDLDGTDAKVKVTADTGAVERDIEGVLAKVDQLTGRPAELLLTANMTAVTSDIADLVLKLDTLDDPHEIRVTADQLNMLNGDLDQLEAKLRSVSDTPVTIETGNARKGIDEIGKSADSSKSVLANMVGNATQDLGALGGVAGSAGVAIGQMGEYMADAATAGDTLGQILGNFGKVAGPIAAISIGIGLVTKVIGDIQKKNEEIAQSSKAIAEGIADDFKTVADSLGDLDVGDFGERLAANFLKTQETAGRTVLALKELGLGADALGQSLIALDSGGAGRLQFLEGVISSSGKFVGNVDAMSASLAHAVVAGESFDDILTTMTTLHGQAGADFVTNNKKMIDAIEQLDDAGENLSLDQVLEQTKAALLNTAGGVDAFIQATSELGAGASQIDIVNRALQILAENNAAEVAAEHVRALNQAYQDAKTDTFAEAQERAAAAIERVNGVLKAQADTLNSQVDAATRAADSQLAANDAFRTFSEVLGDAEASTDSVVDAAVGLSKASAQLAVDQAAAAGATASTTSTLDAQNGALLSTASTASGPARTGILDYIASVNQIPPEKMTDIQAAIDRGDVEEAKRLLDEASATRLAAIIADANTAAAAAELERLTANRTVLITARLNPNYGSALGVVGRPRAGGGTVGPHEAGIAGEAGAEFVRYPSGQQALLTEATLVPPGTQVTSARRTKAILSRRGLPRYANGGTVPIPITVPVPVTVNVNAAVIGNAFEVDRAVTKALRRFQRFNGQRP